MSLVAVRRFAPIHRQPQVRRFRTITTTPFAPEPACFVLDREEENVPAYYRIIGRSRFTPRQQLNIDRAAHAVGRDRKVTVSTFPADRVRIRISGQTSRTAALI